MIKPSDLEFRQLKWRDVQALLDRAANHAMTVNSMRGIRSDREAFIDRVCRPFNNRAFAIVQKFHTGGYIQKPGEHRTEPERIERVNYVWVSSVGWANSVHSFGVFEVLCASLIPAEPMVQKLYLTDTAVHDLWIADLTKEQADEILSFFQPPKNTLSRNLNPEGVAHHFF